MNQRGSGRVSEPRGRRAPVTTQRAARPSPPREQSEPAEWRGIGREASRGGKAPVNQRGSGREASRGGKTPASKASPRSGGGAVAKRAAGAKGPRKINAPPRAVQRRQTLEPARVRKLASTAEVTRSRPSDFPVPPKTPGGQVNISAPDGSRANHARQCASSVGEHPAPETVGWMTRRVRFQHFRLICTFADTTF